MSSTIAEFPDALQFLFHPSRYKVLYGGRGSAKSWGVARALLILGAQKALRIPCCREFQKSISDSVHALLSNQIELLGLSAFYEIKNTEIVGVNGTQFTFHGLKHNITNIKSLEGADVCWIEEAQTVSKSSWDVLIPTIRKTGSELWITYNPELEADETHQRFVVRPPTGAVVAKLTYRDNPWFNDVLKQEMLDLKVRDSDAHDNVWEGNCKKAVEGAIYSKEISLAESEKRIARVPYNPSKPVSTFWDLGWSDMVSIWMVQKVGFEYHAIDYLQDRQQTVEHYVRELQKRPYVYDTDYLPHDGKNKTLGSGGKSIEDMVRGLGRKVISQKNLSIADGINAARTIFGNCWFDSEKCADGLQCLRHYRYDVDPDTGQFSKQPLHNWASHGADAFRGFAISTRDVGQSGVLVKPIPTVSHFSRRA